MPYPNEHACRVRDPKQFKEMRRSNKAFGDVDVIYGIDDSGDSVVQALRFPVGKYTADAARKWAKAHDFSCIEFEAATEPDKADHAKLKTVDLDGEEVFAAGKWTSSNGKTREYSIDDLHLMAEAAREMGPRFKAPVKLGHNDKQALAAVDGVFGDDGKPAFGWMQNLRVAGTKLIADLKGIPAKLAELIKAGAYKNKSFENYNDYTDEVTGKKYKYMPCGVALLGESLPALGNLNELAALYSQDGVPGNTVFLFQSLESDNSNHAGGDTMTPEEQKKMDALEAKCADLEKQLGEYKAKHTSDAEAEKAAADAKLKEAEAKVTEHAAQIETVTKENGELKAKLAVIETEKAEADAKYRATETASFLDKHSKKIPPVFRAIIEEKLNAASVEPEKFSMKVGDTELSGLDAFKAYIEKLPENELFADAGKTSKDTDGEVNEDSEDFYERVEKPAALKYCEEHKLDPNTVQFGDALTAIRNARKAAK